MAICKSELAKRPLLYTDSIGGEQVCRDDMWAVTTEELNAANERIRELEATRDTWRADLLDTQNQGKRVAALLTAERAVSNRLLDALKVSADEIGYIAFKCERDTTTLQSSRKLIAEVEAMRKENE